MKKLIRIFSFFLLLLLACIVLFDFNPLTAFAASGNNTTDGSVYDAEDNALYHHAQTNVVFSVTSGGEAKISHDDTSTPLYYNPATKEFQNGKVDVLSVYDRPSSRGGKYLRNKGYQVRSVSLGDTFYELPLRAGGTIYVTVIWEKTATRPLMFWEVKNNDIACGEWFFYDLLGQKQSHNLFKDEITKSHNIVRLQYNKGKYPTANATGSLFYWSSIKNYPQSTLFDLLEKINVLNDDAIVFEAKDNRGKNITGVDGQLFDYFDYPILDADMRPVFYEKVGAPFNTVRYFGIDGRPFFVDEDGYLVDYYYENDLGGLSIRPEPVRVHSVVNNLLNDELLYFFFMRDGVTICPLYGEPQTKIEDGQEVYSGKMSFAYLNGDPIKSFDFIIPDISTEDVYIRYPELRPSSSAGSFDFSAWFNGLFSGSGDGLSNFFSSVGGIITTGLIVFIAVIIIREVLKK